MATISSPGIGSGLDINGLVSKLMQVEQIPLATLQKREASYQTQITAFGALQGTFASLQTAAQTLAAKTSFTSMTASASDATVLAAAADTTAVAGSYNIGVEQLAKNQVINTSGNYSTADTFKGGSLAITVGSTTTNVSIADGSNLDAIRQSINGANIGVSATLVNAGPPGNYSRLVLTSGTTGSNGAITIAVTQTGTGGTPIAPGVVRNLTDLSFAGTTTGTMTLAQAADNAVLSVNNVSITRSSNTITDAITGVSLSLIKAGTIGTPVKSQLTVSPDKASAQSNITAFVTAYNTAASLLRTDTAYNATNNQASTLTGNATVRALETQLTSLAQNTVTGLAGGISGLSDIGITMKKDGTLTVDSSKLQAALADPTKDVMGLFTSTASGNTGIAVRFNTTLTSVLGVGGAFASATDGINQTIKTLSNQQSALQVRLTAIQKRYLAQFNALDTLVASMQSTQSYLTQQLSSLSSLANYTVNKSG